MAWSITSLALFVDLSDVSLMTVAISVESFITLSEMLRVFAARVVSIDVMASAVFSWSFDISSPTVFVKCSVWAFLASVSAAVAALASSTRSFTLSEMLRVFAARVVSIDVMASAVFSWSFDISSPTVLVKCSVWAFLASDSAAVVALASSTRSNYLVGDVEGICREGGIYRRHGFDALFLEF